MAHRCLPAKSTRLCREQLEPESLDVDFEVKMIVHARMVGNRILYHTVFRHYPTRGWDEQLPLAKLAGARALLAYTYLQWMTRPPSEKEPITDRMFQHAYRGIRKHRELGPYYNKIKDVVDKFMQDRSIVRQYSFRRKVKELKDILYDMMEHPPTEMCSYEERISLPNEKCSYIEFPEAMSID